MVENEYTSSEVKVGAVVNEGLRTYMVSVYNYMAAALSVTGLVAFLIASNHNIMSLFFNMETGGMSGLGWIAMFSPLLIIFGFGWVMKTGTVAQLKGVFFLFASLMAVSLSPILMVYTGTSVTRVFLITAATFGSMSIYGYTTKKDLTSWGSFLRMGLWGIIIAMVVNFFMKSSAMDYAISAIAVCIFTALTAYDTQKIKEIYQSSDSSDTQARKVLMGALSLYLDFINLFIHLMRILGDRR